MPLCLFCFQFSRDFRVYLRSLVSIINFLENQTFYGSLHKRRYWRSLKRVSGASAKRKAREGGGQIPYTSELIFDASPLLASVTSQAPERRLSCLRSMLKPVPSTEAEAEADAGREEHVRFVRCLRTKFALRLSSQTAFNVLLRWQWLHEADSPFIESVYGPPQRWKGLSQRRSQAPFQLLPPNERGSWKRVW